MKKTLFFVICSIFFVSLAMAVPHPKSKNQKNLRVINGKTPPPKPPMIRR